MAASTDTWAAASEATKPDEGKAEVSDPPHQAGPPFKDIKIKSLDIYLFPPDHQEIWDHWLFSLEASLKDKVLKIILVQKQTHTHTYTGQLKTSVTPEDYKWLVCLGVKCSKEVATAICVAITLAKLSINPCGKATGATRWASPIPPLQGDWPLWLCPGAHHLHPQRNWHLLRLLYLRSCW